MKTNFWTMMKMNNQKVARVGNTPPRHSPGLLLFLDSNLRYNPAQWLRSV